jgi:glycine betaine/choline ABC-type transport system substrate-binding protein
MDRAKAIALLTALLAAGCSRAPQIVVGSKDFTEQNVVGEILAQHIERRLRVPVVRKLNLGGTLLAHQALVNGSLDLYPEYTGTALTAILKLPPSPDPEAVFRRVADEYRRRWQLSWIAPLGFNNTFAMVVRRETAREKNIVDLSGAARRVDSWTLGAGYEFARRPDGLDGLVKTYGLKLSGPPVVMDLGLLYHALENRQVDMIAANSTDGLLSALDVVVLKDDEGYFPPYQCAVVVREQALAAFPALRSALEELRGKLPEARIRRLNFQVDGEHRALREVAREFLDSIEAPR